MRVGKLNPVAKAEKARGGFVPGDAARRYTGGVEVPAAEHNLVALFEHTLTAGDYIAHKVLPVTVNGDNAFCFRQLLFNVFKRGFQPPPLAAVYLVMQNVYLRVRGFGRAEIFLVLFVTAVINNYNVLKALLAKPVHHAEKLFVRVERGKNDCQGI